MNETTTSADAQLNLTTNILSLTEGDLLDVENPYYYLDGEVIPQQWNIGFIFLAYFTAFMGSYAAIRLLEHGLWRSERERENATAISKYPKLSYAIVLGSCTIWSMHFIGMQAVVLEHVDLCYHWVPTVCSLLLSVTGVWLGVEVASNDLFGGDDRVEVLKQLLQSDPLVTSKLDRNKASRHIHLVALFYRLHWIAAGSILAALGALSMHFVGMIALKGPFRREWSIPYLSASVLVGCVVAFAGFWILFRPLHWKVEKSWYRQASAGVIALAVCFLHFLGMLSVTYVADSSLQDNQQCSSKESWQGWRPDQLKVLCVAMMVPFIAFYIEHAISNELRVTYRQLLDIRLTGSQFIGSTGGARSYCSSRQSSRFSSGLGSTHSRKSNIKISGLTAPTVDGSDSTARHRRISMMSEDSNLSEHQRMWNLIYKCAEETETNSAAMLEEASHEDESSEEEEEEKQQEEEDITPSELAQQQQQQYASNQDADPYPNSKPLTLSNPPSPSMDRPTISTMTSDSSLDNNFVPGVEADLEAGVMLDLDTSHTASVTSRHQNFDDTDRTHPDDASPTRSPRQALERFRPRASLLLEGVLDDISDNVHQVRRGSQPHEAGASSQGAMEAGSSRGKSTSSRVLLGVSSQSGSQRRSQPSAPTRRQSLLEQVSARFGNSSRREPLERGQHQSAGNVLDKSDPGVSLRRFASKPHTLQSVCNTWSLPAAGRRASAPSANDEGQRKVANESA